MRTVLNVTMLLVLLVAVGMAQVNSGCDATRSCTTLYFYSGANLAYVCSAAATVSPVAVQKSDASLTNIVVSSNVGTVTTASVHGLYIGAVVVVSGSTTAALNGTYIVATVPSTTTFTIATVAVSDATYATAGLSLTTNSPTTGSPVWRIVVYRYVANVLTSTSLGGGSISFNYRAKCTDGSLY